MDDTDKLGAIGDIIFSLDQMEVPKDLLIMAGDNIFEFNIQDLINFGKEHGPTIGAYQLASMDLASQYGVLNADENNKITNFYEKPKNPISKLVSTGVYYYPEKAKEIFYDYKETGENLDAPGYFIQWLVAKMDAYAYLISGNWFDIGDIDSYEHANKYFS